MLIYSVALSLKTYGLAILKLLKSARWLKETDVENKISEPNFPLALRNLALIKQNPQEQVLAKLANIEERNKKLALARKERNKKLALARKERNKKLALIKKRIQKRRREKLGLELTQAQQQRKIATAKQDFRKYITVCARTYLGISPGEIKRRFKSQQLTAFSEILARKVMPWAMFQKIFPWAFSVLLGGGSLALALVAGLPALLLLNVATLFCAFAFCEKSHSKYYWNAYRFLKKHYGHDRFPQKLLK